MPELSLLSLNIEGPKHFHRIVPFVQQHQPDVICFQEVFEKDMPLLEQAFGKKGWFLPLADVAKLDELAGKVLGIWGIAIFTALEVKSSGSDYYYGTAEEIWPFAGDENPNSFNRGVLWNTITKDGQDFTIATTHFTWAPGGGVSAEQERDLPNLFKVLAEIPQFILCGDFNAPRGQRIFGQLAEKYKNNIPAEVTTTIDADLHRVNAKSEKKLQLVVDGLFSTPAYQVSNVQVHSGLSDHCGVTGNISKK